jgi:CRISPR-associated endonuclease/helicase Cas3
MYLDLKIFGVDESYLAHTPDEKLTEHLYCTKKYLERIILDKNLDEIINDLIKSIDSKHFEFIKEMFYNTIYLHDLGKMNSCFQAKKMNNPLYENYQVFSS